MEPIEIDFYSDTLKFCIDRRIVVVCSNVIYVGKLETSGSAAFFTLTDPAVLPIDALSDIEDRLGEARRIPCDDIEINKFQVQAVFCP